MEKPRRNTDSKIWLKVIVLLLALLVSPVFMEYNSYTMIYVCALFMAEPPVYAFETTGYAFVLASPQLIFLLLVESLPCIFFFVRIHRAGRTGSIKRLLTMSVATTIILGTFLPFVWPLALPFIWSSYFISNVAYGFPTLAVLGLVLIPAFVHESSLHVALDTHARENTVSGSLSNRVTGIRLPTLGLVISVATLILPSLAVVYTSSYPYQATLVNVIAYLGIGMNYDFLGGSGISIYISVLAVAGLVLTLAISSVRIVFARKLILYLRGIGGVRRVVTIGFIGESLAFCIYVFPTLFLSPYSPQPQYYPLPFLLVMGLVLVRFRNSVTSVAVKSEVGVQPLPHEVGMWPLTLEEEGVVIGTAPSQRPQYIRVPVAYVILSRVRHRRRHLHE